jgi:hypothetical protein
MRIGNQLKVAICAVAQIKVAHGKPLSDAVLAARLS